MTDRTELRRLLDEANHARDFHEALAIAAKALAETTGKVLDVECADEGCGQA